MPFNLTVTLPYRYMLEALCGYLVLSASTLWWHTANTLERIFSALNLNEYRDTA